MSMSAANLDKQIKRHVIGRPHQFFALCAPGLEEICARELTRLSDTIAVTGLSSGGVDFKGRLDDLMQANLQTRTAGRILMRLADFKATNFRQLRKKAAAVAWERYLPHGSLPGFRFSARRSRIYHSEAVAEQLHLALAEYWREHGVVPKPDPDQTLYCRMAQDIATLSLDSSGPNLYLRGIKGHNARAPLRETMAAGILLLAGYDTRRPLLDPMCGAGTFSLEAALMAKGIPPGRQRGFAFMQWPAYRPQRWRHWIASADGSSRNLLRPLIYASDLDGAACERLAETVAAFRLTDAVRVTSCDFFDIQPTMDMDSDAQTGLVVLNPPYGRRLAPDHSLRQFYARVGEKLRADFKGWQSAVIAPEAGLLGNLPVEGRTIRLLHGGLTIHLQVGTIT